MSNCVEYEGVKYATGSAGSLLLSCPKCGRDQFRGEEYFKHPEWHTCLGCGAQVEAVRMDELETKWKPLWDSVDNEQTE